LNICVNTSAAFICFFNTSKRGPRTVSRYDVAFDDIQNLKLSAANDEAD
jgi:hypothetical protein